MNMTYNSNNSPEEYRRRYKKDRRKPMSVRAHTKLRAVTAMFAGLFMFYTAISMTLIDPNSKDDPVDIAIFSVLGLGMFISGFIWCMNLASYKMEPDDEMSEQLRGKANGLAFGVWFPAMLSVMLLLEHFHSGAASALLKNQNYALLSASGLLTYNSVRHTFFLMLDKAEKTEEEEE